MELPYELVDEILIRVPVKYLLRCRCVSKTWCSVIDSTEFVEKYLEESVERNRGGIIIQGSDLDGSSGKCLLADLESLDNDNVVIDISEEVKGILDGASLVGSANGLVCLSMSGDDDDDVDLILFNPCTRKYKKVPFAGTELLDCNNLGRYYLFGFGYDHVSDDYKVVMMGSCRLANCFMANVYSLKKNSWTPNPNVFRCDNIGFTDRRGLFVDGALRWKAIDVTYVNSVIVGFDISLEQFTEARYYNGIVNVLLMDDRVEKSQAKEISANPVFGCFGYPRLVMYSKSLEKILFEVNNERFVWYHFKSKTFQNVRIPGIQDRFYSHKYIESLFPLIEDRQPSLEAKEKNQQPQKTLDNPVSGGVTS